MNDIGLYILIAASVVLSALFSGSENALASANKLRLKKSADEGKKRSALALRLSEDFSHTISTILLGNNLVNIIASTAATILCVTYFKTRGEAIASVSMTVILLIFGEIMPKIVSVEYADTLAPLVARPIRAIMFVFYPIVAASAWFVDRLSKLWTHKEPEASVTPDELCTMVEEIEEEGVITESESELIRSAIDFTDVTAREIMIPRVDVAAFDIDEGAGALLADEELLKHSRFPVYRDTLDNVIGVLSTRRVIRAAASGEKIDLEALLRPPVFVHMTRTISSILHEFRRTRSQMAIVVDEFGGTMGILTREDIIEEIVGEIYDEKDEEEEPDVVNAGGGSYVVDGGLNIYDMFELIGYTPRDFSSEYTTVGGWATEMLDKFPEEGDVFEFERLTVTVTEAQSMRVEKLLVTVDDEEDDDDDR